jgi:RNA polymerase sigma factor (sigma-70 family)
LVQELAAQHENGPMNITATTPFHGSFWADEAEKGDAHSSSVTDWLQHRLAEWPIVWAACTRRTRRWRVPPRWSLCDWREELDAECIASACRAIRIFDPERGPTLASFVFHTVFASALARYRGEWSYSLRYARSPCSWSDPGGTDAVEERFAAAEEKQAVKRLINELPEIDRRLIQCLFWEDRTETEVAGGLGITQQAVSKRKYKILNAMRMTLTKTEQK